MYILYDIWKFFNMKRWCFTPLHLPTVRNETGWFLNVLDLCDLQLQRKSGKPRWNRWMAVPEIWGELTQSVEGGEGFGSWNAPLKNTKVFFINPRWLVGDGISEPNQQYMFFFSGLFISYVPWPDELEMYMYGLVSL